MPLGVFHFLLTVFTDLTASKAATATVKLVRLSGESLQYSKSKLVCVASVVSESFLFLLASNVVAKRMLSS